MKTNTQGLYYCLLISVSSCLTVDHFPRTPVRGESLTLVCSLNTTEKDTVCWIKDGYRYSRDCDLNDQNIGDIGDDPYNYNVTCDVENTFYQYNLTIHRLEKHKHGGTWQCIHIFDSENLDVTVLVRADQPVWTPGAGDYREGQLYNLTCSTNVADPVPSFSWWIAGPNNVSSELEGALYVWQNENGMHNTIAFLPNRTLEGVDVWCRLYQSQFGKLDSDHNTVNVTYGPGAPSLRFTDDAVYAGGAATMFCLFTPGPDGTDGNPTVREYTWLFGNETLVDSNSSEVTFAVTSVTQEGEYSCFGINNPVGGPIRGDASQPAFLIVNISPYLVQQSALSDNVVILYNDQNTSLSCLGAGKPEVDFNWYHNGDKVDKADFLVQKHVEAGDYLYDLQYGWRSYLMRAVGGAYFSCDNITKYDGQYQCEAYNHEWMSKMSAPVTLNNHYPAHWAGPVPYPKRYTFPGDNFTLLCDVCMEPRGNIKWYLNGKPVRDIVSIIDDGRNLTLTDVQLEDFGNYTCQVTNIILEENYTKSFDILLVERGSPHTPHVFQVDGSTSRSLNVSWQPGSTGGYDSQTFTLCFVDYDVYPSCQVGIKDPGDGNLIRESLRDLEVSTTYQLQLYAENAHHGNNRSSLTEMNHSTKDAPVIKFVGLTLSAARVTVTWVVEAGEPSHLTLVHCPSEDCDVTTQRSRRDVKATWRELATNIPPDVGTYTYEAEEGDPFDVYSHNRFSLWAYEPGLNDRSNTDDDNAVRDVHSLSSGGVDIRLVVGIVLAVVAAAVLATGGFVYYRKKATKDGGEQSSNRPSDNDNNKSSRDDKAQYEDINEGSREHSVSSASSALKEYGAYEDVTKMSIMATSRPHRAGPDDAVCVDVPRKLPFDEVDDDVSYMGLYHHDNKDNNAYEELQVTATTT